MAIQHILYEVLITNKSKRNNHNTTWTFKTFKIYFFHANNYTYQIHRCVMSSSSGNYKIVWDDTLILEIWIQISHIRPFASFLSYDAIKRQQIVASIRKMTILFDRSQILRSTTKWFVSQILRSITKWLFPSHRKMTDLFDCSQILRKNRLN